MKLDISIELATALVELHSGTFKVSHNDIKPMNILLNLLEREKGFYELKKLGLADFGISSVMKTSTFVNTQKMVTGGNGTFDYIAPEVILNGKYYHIKTDVYSFGRVINHLFFSPNWLILENKKDGVLNLEI